MYQIANIRRRFATLFVILFILAFTGSAYATPEAVDAKVLTSFSNSFANAKSVTWKVTKRFSKASFINDNKRTEVFYDNHDQLIGTSVYVTLKDLPSGTEGMIAKDYSGYRVTSAIQYTDAQDQLNYFVQVENDTKSKVLQVTPDGEMTEMKSTRK